MWFKPLTLYNMSCFKLLKTQRRELNSLTERFWWGTNGSKKENSPLTTHHMISCNKSFVSLFDLKDFQGKKLEEIVQNVLVKTQTRVRELDFNIHALKLSNASQARMEITIPVSFIFFSGCSKQYTLSNIVLQYITVLIHDSFEYNNSFMRYKYTKLINFRLIKYET